PYSERDAEVARGRQRVLVGLDALDAVRDFGQRDGVEAWRIERNHDARLAAVECADGGGSEAEAEHAVENVRCAAADHVSECDGARFLAGAVREVGRDVLRDSAVATRPLRPHALAADLARAFGAHEDVVAMP